MAQRHVAAPGEWLKCRGRRMGLVDSRVSLTYDRLEAVLHGELAVPCTRNPLQRGGTPSPGLCPRSLSSLVDVESWVLGGGNPKTPSGPDVSSGKWKFPGAPGKPGSSRQWDTPWMSDQRRVHGFS